MKLPPFLIDDILPTGLTLLSGKPKVGKSWLMLEYCYAVAFGGTVLGRFPAQIQGGVLYISSTMKSVQNRLQSTLGESPQPQHITFSLPPSKRLRFGHWLRDMLALHPHVRLVAVDTIADILPAFVGDTFPYQMEQAFSHYLACLCHECNISLVLIHNARMVDDGGPRCGIGLASGCDCVMSLSRLAPHPRLGRQVEGRRLTITTHRMRQQRQVDLEWDAVCACWRVAGDEEGGA